MEIKLLVPTVFAAVAMVVIAWTNWGRSWSVRARAEGAAPGRIVAATVVINPKPIARADPHPTTVTLHIEHGDDETFSTTTSSRHLPVRVARRVVGFAHVFHAPRLPVADRDAALAQARDGGVTFAIEPPIAVTVYRAGNALTWS